MASTDWTISSVRPVAEFLTSVVTLSASGGETQIQPHWGYVELVGRPACEQPFYDLPQRMAPFVVVAQFEPSREDEVALAEGDLVKLKKAFRDGWALGRNVNTDILGILPLDHLMLGTTQRPVSMALSLRSESTGHNGFLRSPASPIPRRDPGSLAAPRPLRHYLLIVHSTQQGKNMLTLEHAIALWIALLTLVSHGWSVNAQLGALFPPPALPTFTDPTDPLDTLDLLTLTLPGRGTTTTRRRTSTTTTSLAVATSSRVVPTTTTRVNVPTTTTTTTATTTARATTTTKFPTTTTKILSSIAKTTTTYSTLTSSFNSSIIQGEGASIQNQTDSSPSPAGAIAGSVVAVLAVGGIGVFAWARYGPKKRKLLFRGEGDFPRMGAEGEKWKNMDARSKPQMHPAYYSTASGMNPAYPPYQDSYQYHGNMNRQLDTSQGPGFATYHSDVQSNAEPSVQQQQRHYEGVSQSYGDYYPDNSSAYANNHMHAGFAYSPSGTQYMQSNMPLAEAGPYTPSVTSMKIDWANVPQSASATQNGMEPQPIVEAPNPTEPEAHWAYVMLVGQRAADAQTSTELHPQLAPLPVIEA
ncbi:hypothetical protein HDU93_008826, partial [Gonapodya sp. JEL0774]